MADRIIEIIIDTNDRTGGKLEGLKKSLLEIDAAAQRTRNKLAAIGRSTYAATIRLIDRVTTPGSRINSLLKSIANKIYTVTMRLNDSVLSKIRSVEASLMRLAGRAYTVAINIKDNVTGKLKGLTDGILMGAGAMGVGMLGTAGIGYGAVNAAQAFMGFEKQMSQVQAIRQLEKNSPEMQALTQQAKDLGAQTAWTREQVGQAQYYEALAGWETAQILKSTPHLMNLASAGNVDLKSTADIVTDSLTGFGIQATETYLDKQGRYVNAVEHYADMIAKLQASSNTDILQAGEAFKYSAPSVGAMFSGKDIQTRMQAAEDAMIMTGLMANAGIKGSMAGTGINNIFNRMGSMNRNAYQALRAMNVQYTDENGDMLSIGTIMRNLGKRFKEGVDPNELLNFAEEIAGEKIHADTRRKLDSFIEQTQKNGGRMSGSDMLKMSSMLAGAEHMGKLLAVMLGDWDAMAEKMDNVHGTASEMAKTQLDNLAGSFTILGSAWDAFQQSFFEGQAGDGLRNFVDSLTEIITRANNLFKDGIQLGDIGKIAIDVVDRLKNKFLELDGIGSILAGGALMAGLMKIGSVVQKTIGYFRTLKGLEIGQRTSSAGISGGTKVGTMTVSAGVVNVNGKVNGTVGGNAGTGSRRVGNQAIMENYYAQKARIRGETARTNHLLNMKSTAASGAAFASLFAALDVFNAKSLSDERNKNAAEELATARAEYRELIAQGRSEGELAQSAARIQELEHAQIQIVQENKQHEREVLAGATGSVLGAAVGAGLGSFLPGFGTMLGGIIGSIIGEKLGLKTIEDEEENHYQRKAEENGWEFKRDYYGDNEPAKAETAPPTSNWADFRVAEDASRNYYLRYQRDGNQDLAGIAQAQARRREADNREQERAQATADARRRFDNRDRVLHATEGYQEWGLPGFRGFNNSAEYAAQNFYQSQAQNMAEHPEQFQWQPFQNIPRAEAAELNEEQLLQQAQMERGEFQSPAFEEQLQAAQTFRENYSEIFSGMSEEFTSIFDGLNEQFSTFGEGINENLTSAFEGVGEMVSTFGEGLTENLSAAFEGVGEMVSTFGEGLTENLSAAFEGVGEMVSTFGEGLTENLSAAFEGVGEMVSTFGEGLTENLSAAFEGVGEMVSTFGEGLTENLSAAFEGVGEMVSTFGEGLTENLSAAFEGVGEMVSTFGEGLTENLSAAFEGVGEMVSTFGEQINSGMAAAQSAVESSMSAIQAAFDAGLQSIQSAWAALPGFFEGIFSGLGGAASAAGSAIEAGLTAPIGGIISAWQGAAATVSGIISSISAMASSAASMNPSFSGLGGVGKAEGGFVTSETHFFAGEHGPEVVIPLSPARRARAFDLLEKTTAILGGEAAVPSSDFPELPTLDDESFSLEPLVPIAPVEKISSNNISLGDLNVSFSISGDNPQDILQTIQEHLAELADKIGGHLSAAIGDCFSNQALEG